jgi:hypothetical protein
MAFYVSFSTRPVKHRTALRADALRVTRAPASEFAMAAILPILLFVIAVAAINIVEFKRPD